MKISPTLGVLMSLSAVGPLALTGCATPAPPEKVSSAPVQLASAGARPAADADVEAALGDPQRCAALAGRQIAGTAVSEARYYAVGEPMKPLNLPNRVEFCMVTFVAKPTPASSIRIEVWLPNTWNRKFVGVGGGGFSGSYAVSSIALTPAVSQGYAAVVTDAGHDTSDDAAWALGQPEKIADYGYRSNHIAAELGKAVSQAYYGAGVEKAYFKGCSNGGRDALMLAQRYPADYDAIVVGAPANRFTDLMSSFAQYGQMVEALPAIEALAPKLAMVREAVLARCDDRDGLKDGLIAEPEKCDFDPGAVACADGQTENCLTAPELALVRTIYRGVYTPDGRQIMPGLSPGSEYEWTNWVAGAKAGGLGMGREFFRNMVYSDPTWSFGRFDIARDSAAAQARAGSDLDAVDTDLRPFLRRGGKILFHHGWDDAAIPPASTIGYFEAASRSAGGLADTSMRLFMMPGVAHCSDGKGPDYVDFLGTLDTWVETAKAPDRLVAAKHQNRLSIYTGQTPTVVQTRPLCAWPRSASYSGSGSGDEEASFVCR
ncbi:tannase/feruloyl esterase family alpha/beta hydrolase [Brevundimonas intermedia]|uniref:tannase/feruloyl esterase family alpha/beta hydrolase n=1 Tax=Brevundimonas intermedia TaxID=74315 RepID=UPI003208A8A0